MTRHSLRITGLALSLVVLGLAIAPVGEHLVPGAFAQDAGLDLAAMALDSGDLPPAYQQIKFDDEGYTPGNRIAPIQFGDAVTAEELEPLQIEWFYSSTFFTEDESSWVYVYLTEFAGEAAVAAGFDFLENEERWAPPGDEWEDLPGPSAGGAPKEVTITSNSSSEPGLHAIDATFRVDRVLAGVSVTTTGKEPAQELIEELASKLQERIEAVLAGESPQAVDPELPQITVELFETWPWPGNSLEGYKTAAEFLGAEGTPAQFGSDYQGGYARFASAGSVEENIQHEPPYVDVEIAAFSTSETALAVLQVAEKLPTRHYGDSILRSAAPDPSLSGADAVRAFHTERPAIPDSLDSLNLTGYEVVFVAGSRVVNIRIQSDALTTSLTTEELEASVLDLAAQQVSCLNSAGECGPARIPEPLSNTTGSPASPVAVKIGDEVQRSGDAVNLNEEHEIRARAGA